MDVTSRYTSSNNAWNEDLNFSDQQFTLTLKIDSDNYHPGNFDYWDGHRLSSYSPHIQSVGFGTTPFDEELNRRHPALNYHGNVENPFPGSSYGRVSYAQSYDRGTVSQTFHLDKGLWYRNYQTEDQAYFHRVIHINFTDYNANLSKADIVPLTLEEHLNLGYEQTFFFTQSVEENHNEQRPGNPWITLDGGVRYEGEATMSNISAVPLPATAWLFSSAFIGLAGFARRKKIGSFEK